MTITVTERTLNKRVERISSHSHLAFRENEISSAQTIGKNEISLDLPQLVSVSFKELPLPSKPDYSVYLFPNFNGGKIIVNDDSAVHKLFLAHPNNLFKLNLVVFCPGKILKIAAIDIKTTEEIEKTITTSQLSKAEKIEKQCIQRESLERVYEIDDVPVDKYLQRYCSVKNVEEFLALYESVPKVVQRDIIISSHSPSEHSEPPSASNKHPNNQQENHSLSKSNISMMVLGGFITAAGIAAVAIAFTLLNAATLGTAGLVVMGVGVAAALSGVGLFAANSYNNRQITSDPSFDLSANLVY